MATLSFAHARRVNNMQLSFVVSGVQQNY